MFGKGNNVPSRPYLPGMMKFKAELAEEIQTIIDTEGLGKKAYSAGKVMKVSVQSTAVFDSATPEVS